MCCQEQAREAIALRRCASLQVLLSVAEHHSNLIPWQLIAKRTGAILRYVPLTKDTQELDMNVSSIYGQCTTSLDNKADLIPSLSNSHIFSRLPYICH